MSEKLNIFIFGDSLMKATSPDESMKLHFNIKPYIDRLCREFPVAVFNRSHFGCTVEKGLATLKKELAASDFRGASVLLEYGGNDCDYKWEDVSASPGEEHICSTPLPKFLSMMTEMAELVKKAGGKPLFMTLPPISAEKYLARIVEKGLSRENILGWLGDVHEMYRYHELYSSSIAALAARLGVELVDVRAPFLGRRDFDSLVSNDGIHPTLKGYELVYGALAAHLGQTLA